MNFIKKFFGKSNKVNPIYNFYNLDKYQNCIWNKECENKIKNEFSTFYIFLCDENNYCKNVQYDNTIRIFVENNKIKYIKFN